MSQQIEQKWIEYWSDLYELMEKFNHPVLLDENLAVINLDEAQQKIQDDVYCGKNIEFVEINFNGKKAIQIKGLERVNE